MPGIASHHLVIAAAESSQKSGPMAADAVESGVARIEALPGDIAQIPVLQHLSDVIPAADLVFGGAMLLVIVIFHATGVRFVTNHVVRRSLVILRRPTTWRADLLMSGTVFSGLVPDWRTSGFFAGNTYTTVGYGAFVLPLGWHMLAPIIAISGLFTFGWSGSVLVDLVGRCQKIKDAAAKK
jgi:hypothetical protein